MDTPLSVLLRHKADKLADKGGTLYWVSPPDGEELLGLISIGDLVSLVVEDKTREIADLINYIQG